VEAGLPASYFWSTPWEAAVALSLLTPDALTNSWRIVHLPQPWDDYTVCLPSLEVCRARRSLDWRLATLDTCRPGPVCALLYHAFHLPSVPDIYTYYILCC
jgi:hypothetical protein